MVTQTEALDQKAIIPPSVHLILKRSVYTNKQLSHSKILS